MMQPTLIADQTWWVGLNDRKTDLFEGLWPLPRGVSYNSYLILGEKVVLLDTVKVTMAGAYLAGLDRLLNGRKVDYLITHHLEPDHSGSISLLRQRWPEMKIIGNKKTSEFLREMHGIEVDMPIGDGDALELPGRTLRFYLTPMVHWPETMMTFDESNGTLFSCDAFGGFGTVDQSLFDDQGVPAWYEDDVLRYFSNIVAKYAPMTHKAIGKLGGLGIKTIAPSHGIIWRQDPLRIVRIYDRWSQDQWETGVLVAFGSMYEHTEAMAEVVAAGVRDEGVTLRMYDVSRRHVSYIIRDAWRYGGLILGAPTYDTKLFPMMQHVLNSLPKGLAARRTLGLFGNYGWVGGAVKTMQAWTEEQGGKPVEPIVEVRFRPDDDNLQQCRQLGQNVAQEVKKRQNN